jgi:hypothetical protein
MVMIMGTIMEHSKMDRVMVMETGMETVMETVEETGMETGMERGMESINLGFLQYFF